MSQKKKTWIIIGIIVLVIAGFIGNYQHTKYQLNENLKLAEMGSVFLVVTPEDRNLRKANYTDADLKNFIKNPPKIEMNTRNGLGVKVSAYNYYHDEVIDPYRIREMMESGQFHEAYEYTIDFVHWARNYPDKMDDYKNAVQYAADKLETPLPLKSEDATYQDYLNIINDPEGQKYIDEYFASIGE